MERFFSKVRKTDECWWWLGTKNNKGYGMFMLRSPDKILAHRASYVLHCGPLPEGKNLLHRCDNPACVNPDHLVVGTQRDNQRDMAAKGRGRGGIPGSKHLTDDEVREIRRRYKPRVVTQQILANDFGVSSAMVHFILHGRCRRGAWGGL